MKKLLLILLLMLMPCGARAAEAWPAETVLHRYFGVNLHLSQCCGGRYGDLDQVIADIRYIGARRLRDWAGGKPGLLERWQRVHQETGLPFHASIPVASPEHQRIALGIMEDWLARAPGMIDVIEGGNEEDVPFAQKLGATLADTAALQHEVYAAGKRAGVTVAQLSVGWGWEPPLYEGNYKKFGTPPADVGNAHVYMGVGQSPTYILKRIGELAAYSVKGGPVDVTEFGFYKTAAQDEALTNGYMHIAPFTAAVLGQAGLLVYALYDDESNAMGFYDLQGRKRPFADYWHATTQLLADPQGKGLAVKSINVQLRDVVTEGERSYGVRHVVMHKSDGSVWVALYDEAKAGAREGAATVAFDRDYQNIDVYDGRTGNKVQTRRAARDVRVTLPGNHVFLVRAGDSAAE